jgi:hypothetical protein
MGLAYENYLFEPVLLVYMSMTKKYEDIKKSSGRKPVHGTMIVIAAISLGLAKACETIMCYSCD